MKILYVITKGTWGGAQTHVYNLIKDQVMRNNQITLVVGETGRLVNDIEKNFPQVNLYKIGTLTNELKITNVLRSIKSLRNIIKEINPDIIHLHSTVAGTVGRIAAIGLNKKVIFTVHGSSFTPGVGKKREKFAKLVEKTLLPFTDKLIFVSEFDKNLWDAQIKNFSKSQKGVVIYNGVEDTLKSFGQIYVENKKNKKIEICMAARFSSQKNQKLLIKALKNCSFKNKLHITFLGSGELEKECKNIIGTDETFTFKGSVNNVSKFYANSDIITLISNFEGLPISLIEALPLSKPIIASNVGGIPEIINQNFNGFCVNNDVHEILRAFETLTADKKLRKEMGNNSRLIYKLNFTIKKMLDKTNQIYLEFK